MEIITIILILILMLEVYFIARPRKKRDIKAISMLVDTSVLMDGRVVDLAKTGFLLGQVIVPKSVLAELQLLADGSDHAKRERARLGLDAVRELKEELVGSFVLLQDGPAIRGVDEKLISLAKETDSAILTLDYNLNKVAQVEGVSVLNINELAKSIRMVHLPGDSISIELVQKGQSADQAVGYLLDGTMVVVEQAKKFIGQTKMVSIIRSLQTDAGKMMFARLEGLPQSHAAASKNEAQRQNGGRKPQAADKPAVNKSNARTSRFVKKNHNSENTNTSSQHNKRSAPRPTTNRAPKNTQAQREAELIRLVEEQKT